MGDLTVAQSARLDRMWSAFDRAGLLKSATINASTQVRIEWQRRDADLIGVAAGSALVVRVLESEYATPSRGDTIEVDAVTYQVISVERDGFGAWALGLDRT